VSNNRRTYKASKKKEKVNYRIDKKMCCLDCMKYLRLKCNTWYFNEECVINKKCKKIGKRWYDKEILMLKEFKVIE
jgi:hypothetical protein